MKKRNGKRFLSICLVLAMIIGMVPLRQLISYAAPGDNVYTAADSQTVVDASTAMSYEQMLGTDADGNRYAGRIWSDKTVFDTVTNKTVSLDGGLSVESASSFMAVFSALGSTTQVTTTTSTSRPLDVVFIMDNSRSMGNQVTIGGKRMTRLQAVVNAADTLLGKIATAGNNRIGMVVFDGDSAELLPLDYYKSADLTLSGGYLRMSATRSDDTAYSDTEKANQSGTNLQAGIYKGMSMLTGSKVSGRTPVVIVLADGEANIAVTKNWHNPDTGSTVNTSNVTAEVAASTLLTAAYMTAAVEDAYGMNPRIYSVSVDIDDSDNAAVIMDPENLKGGENANLNFASNSGITMGRKAYGYFNNWYSNGSHSVTASRTSWNFNALPAGSTVTKDDMKDNIYYVDSFEDVSSADISDVFDNIYEEIVNLAFHPITDTSIQGEATPLTYVDFIGDYMEVKKINAVTLYGKLYGVTAGSTVTSEPVKNEATGNYDVTATTTYLVGEANDSITHPVMGDTDRVRNAVRLELVAKYSQDESGNIVTVPEQELWVYLTETAMPLLCDTVSNKDGAITYSSNHDGVGDDPAATYPIRVFYEIDLSSYVVTDGQMDYTMVDETYLAANTDADGNVRFYTNQYGEMNTVNGGASKGDTHSSATPSLENRYYYHQTNYGVLTDAYLTADPSYKVKDHADAGEYGVLYYRDGILQENGQNKYTAVNMTYADLAGMSDSDTVYTYIVFYRPTSGGAGEQVAYIACSSWAELKADISWYDTVNQVYINGFDGTDYITSADAGYVVSASVVERYIADKGLNAANVLASLGIGSWRATRLNNMTVSKGTNATGTAELVVAPQYNLDPIHVGNLVAWLGNNGVITVEGPKDPTGLSITKVLAETVDGAESDFRFTVEIDTDETFTAEFTGGSGWVQNGTTLTGTLSSGETVTIIGLPAGAGYKVTETSDYYAPSFVNGSGTLADQQILSVVATNRSNVGNLYITKEITGTVPDSVMDSAAFQVEVQCAALANKEFAVKGLDGQTTVTFDAEGKLVLTVRARHAIEILALPAGSQVTVTELLPEGSNYVASYESRDYSGAALEPNNGVTITAGTNSVVKVLNAYTPKPAKVGMELDIFKNLIVDDLAAVDPNGYAFDFALEYYDGANWVSQYTWENVQFSQIVQGDNLKQVVTDAVVTLPEGESNFITKAGAYEYRISEVIPQTENKAAGMIYDRTRYYISVTVEDLDGQLTVTDIRDKDGNPITDTDGDGDYDYTVTFVNEFDSAPASIDISKELTNLSGDSTVSKAGFQFIAREAQVDGEGNWSAVDGGAVITVTSDAGGKARMTATYKEPGKHYFLISEVIPDPVPTGWEFTTVEYQVEVEAYLEETTGRLATRIFVNGQLQDSDSITLTFNNTYDPVDAAVTPVVSKALTGREFKESDQFTFHIYANNDRSTVLATGTTNGEKNEDGTLKVTFDKALTMGTVGKFEYDILEVVPADGSKLPGVIYDTTVYDLVVEVSHDAANGKLVADAYFEDSVTDSVTFTNHYVVTGEAYVQLEGEKQLKVQAGAMTLEDDQFLFLVTDSEGNEVARTTNKGNTIRFPQLRYTAADLGKTFTYTVSEQACHLPGVTYSTEKYALEVTVFDDGQGNVAASYKLYKADDATKTQVQLVFENTYRANGTSAYISGTKELIGRELKTEEFAFGVYLTDATFAITGEPAITVYNGTQAVASVAGGDIQTTDMAADRFALVLTGLNRTGNYYMVIRELDQGKGGITYDPATYQITISVEDVGGQLEAKVTGIMKDHHAASAVSFSNRYTAAEVSVPVSALKTMNDNSLLQPGGYQFGIYPAVQEGENYVKNGEPIATAENGENGQIAFRDGVFKNVGTYYFIIAEIIPEEKDDNILYDTSEYLLKVEVTDDGLGQLEAATTVTKNGNAAAAISFLNIHTPDPIRHSLVAQKSYNKELLGGEFKFQLVSADGKTQVDQTKTNAAGGEIAFDPITFESAGIYSFTVKEIDTILGFIQYSVAEYQVFVTVENQSGVLQVTKVLCLNTKGTNESDLNFVNTYVLAGEGQVVLEGTKVLTGDRTKVKNEEFEFGLYDSEGNLLQSVKNDEEGSFRFEALEFDETHTTIDGSKEYTYTVKEIAGTTKGMTYDTTVYTVVVTVEDNDEGGVTVAYTVNGESGTQIVFTNEYDDPTPPVDPSLPSTGDEAPLLLWIGLLLTSAAALFLMVLLGKKRRHSVR